MQDSATTITSDRICIEKLECQAVIGCLPEEKVSPQPLCLSVVLELDLAPAGRSDDLKQTADYAAIAEKLRTHVEHSRVQLLETLAEQLAVLVLKDFRIHAVTIRIEKPQAIPHARCAAVEIRRNRISVS